VFQRFAQVASTRLYFVEQPHILDRDHRLVGEGGHQVNLILRKRSHRGSYQRDHTDRGVLSQERHTKHGAEMTKPHSFRQSVFRISVNIGDVNDPGLESSSPRQRSSSDRNWMLFEILFEFARVAVIGGKTIDLAIAQEKKGAICLAQPGPRFDQRVEHNLEIKGRAADDLEHVGGGGLLLQRFAQLIYQPSILDRDDSLRGEIRDQLDLLASERADLLVKDADGADQLLLLEHRHNEQRPDTAKLDASNRQRIALEIGSVGTIIDHIDGVAGLDDSTDWVERSGMMRLPLQELCESRRYVELRYDPGGAILEPNQSSKLGLTDANGVRQHGLEHRSKLAGRA
jgi:hypothetical protein